MFFPFNLKLGAQLTTYAGVLLAFSAAAGWLREDAKNDVRTEIQAEFQTKTDALIKDAALKSQKVEFMQKVLKGTEEEAAKLQGANNELLEKQKDAIPLSEACNVCRVPNERLWLRERAKGPAAGPKPAPGT